jgi:hypothetical protein
MEDFDWKVQIKGSRNGGGWEVAIVRESFEHGKKSWGWCDEDLSDLDKCKKILIGTYCERHCSGRMIPGAMDVAILLAQVTLEKMRNGIRIDE